MYYVFHTNHAREYIVDAERFHELLDLNSADFFPIVKVSSRGTSNILGPFHSIISAKIENRKGRLKYLMDVITYCEHNIPFFPRDIEKNREKIHYLSSEHKKLWHWLDKQRESYPEEFI